MQTAIVIGATGLTGSNLVEQLLAHPDYDRVLVFTRRSTAVHHPGLEEHLIDFSKPDQWRDRVRGDVLFSALGTTLQQAGNQKKQYEVDYTYQYQFAEAAAMNGVPCYVLVSSARANPQSRLFYTRMKGALERDVSKLPFVSVTLIRPGLLTGDRTNNRLGESFAYRMIQLINSIGLLKRYRPVTGRKVATAMIKAAKQAARGIRIYELDEVIHLSEETG